MLRGTGRPSERAEGPLPGEGPPRKAREDSPSNGRAPPAIPLANAGCACQVRIVRASVGARVAPARLGGRCRRPRPPAQSARAHPRGRAAELRARGDAYLAAGDRGSAIGWYRDALSVDPSDGASYAALGRIYLDRGALADARAAFEAGVRRAPDHPPVWLGPRRDAGTAWDRGDDAADAMRELTRRRPRDAVAWRARAELARRRWGAWSEALGRVPRDRRAARGRGRASSRPCSTTRGGAWSRCASSSARSIRCGAGGRGRRADAAGSPAVSRVPRRSGTEPIDRRDRIELEASTGPCGCSASSALAQPREERLAADRPRRRSARGARCAPGSRRSRSPTARGGRSSVDERDLRGVRRVGEHRLAEERAPERDAVETARRARRRSSPRCSARSRARGARRSLRASRR